MLKLVALSLAALLLMATFPLLSAVIFLVRAPAVRRWLSFPEYPSEDSLALVHKA
jgi:hypothetical protein